MAPSLAFLPNVGLPEILILLAIVILIFGPKRIPQAARSLGHSIRNFRDSVSDEEKPELKEGDAEVGPPGDSASESSVTSGESKPGP